MAVSSERIAGLVAGYHARRTALLRGTVRPGQFDPGEHWAGMALAKSGGCPLAAIEWVRRAGRSPRMVRAGFDPGRTLRVLSEFVVQVSLRR